MAAAADSGSVLSELAYGSGKTGSLKYGNAFISSDLSANQGSTGTMPEHLKVKCTHSSR